MEAYRKEMTCPRSPSNSQPGQDLNQGAEPGPSSARPVRGQMSGPGKAVWDSWPRFRPHLPNHVKPGYPHRAQGSSVLALPFQGPNSWAEGLLGSWRPLNAPPVPQALPSSCHPPSLLVLTLSQRRKAVSTHLSHLYKSQDS